MTEQRSSYQVQHASGTGRWGTCHPTRYGVDGFDDACIKALELADKDGKPHRVVKVVSSMEVLFTADAGHRPQGVDEPVGKVLAPPAGYCDRGPCILNQDHEGVCTT